jgi:hypothetical protein
MDKFLAKKHAIFKDNSKSKNANHGKEDTKVLFGFSNLTES